MQRGSIKIILIVFCASFLFQSQQGLSEDSVKKPAVKETEKKKDEDSKQTDARKVASVPYSCSEVWTDEFSFGYVKVGATCSSEDSLCFAFFHIARNYCEGDILIRHYCDPKQPSLVATEKIECKKSCEFSGLSGVCVKED
ncbi:MAG: hypothetical protein OXN83_04450 [Oligoflexia bacterium]|nr:hypothetical protein [Oligoflexia bacterium]